MSNVRRFTCIGVSMFALCGCNPVTTQDLDVSPAMTTLATKGGDNSVLLQQMKLDNQDLMPTPELDLPTSGYAGYAGYVKIAPDGMVLPKQRGALVGEADLFVEFGPFAEFGGTIENFEDNSGTYDGVLWISVGNLDTDKDGTYATGNLDGLLTRSSGEKIEVAGDLTGRFYGPDANYLNGSDKTLIISDGTRATTKVTLDAIRK